MEEEWNVGLAEWSGSPWHVPSGVSVHWWSTCQEPLILNRIRPDWQAITLLPANGVTGRKAACDFLPAETAERTLDLDVSAGAIVGKNSGQKSWNSPEKSGSKMSRSRKSFGRLSSPSMHSDTVLPSGMMGSVVLLGVCALSVREGWWTVLIEGLQLRRGGETALPDGEVLLYGFK